MTYQYIPASQLHVHNVALKALVPASLRQRDKCRKSCARALWLHGTKLSVG